MNLEAARYTPRLEATQNCGDQAIIHECRDFGWLIIEDVGDQVDARQHQVAHCLINLLIMSLGSLIDFEDLGQDIILNDGGLKDLPGVRNHILIVVHHVLVILNDALNEYLHVELEQLDSLVQSLMLT